MERPLLRLRLSESFLIGDSERPREDLLTDRDLDLESERRLSPREWLRERRRSRSRDPRPPLRKIQFVLNKSLFAMSKHKYLSALTACDHDRHVDHHDHHYGESAEMSDVHSVPFGLSTLCRQACDRPWLQAHLQHLAYRRTYTKRKR